MSQLTSPIHLSIFISASFKETITFTTFIHPNFPRETRGEVWANR